MPTLSILKIIRHIVNAATAALELNGGGHSTNELNHIKVLYDILEILMKNKIDEN